ncbi:MAG: hypothetical protein ABW079_17060 [Sedimenticola sp.]
MKPHFLAQEQREALEKLINDLAIGDRESRELFIRALEYELAEYEELEEEAEEAASAPHSTAGDSSVNGLVSAVDNLLTALGDLAPARRESLTRQLSTDDTFARDHDARYLSALEVELSRLGSACKRLARPAKQVRISEPDQKLIAMMAEAYEECFEKLPSGRKGQPFYKLVSGVVKTCNLKTPSDEASLERVIRSD